MIQVIIGVDGFTISYKTWIKKALVEFDECRSDLLKEIGDEYWYLTRFIQCIGLNWNNIEKLNIIKLKERQKRNLIIGKGNNREDD